MAPTSFEQADAAIPALKRSRPDLLMTDIRMPGRSGLELLTEIRDNQPELPVIVMTAHSDLDSAVAAYQGGGFEYLPKPFDIVKPWTSCAGRATKNRTEIFLLNRPHPEMLDKPACRKCFAPSSLARST